MMPYWERLEISLEEWARLIEQYSDRTVFHSPAWLRFLEDAIGGELVFAALHDGHSESGYFAGMIIRKFGLRILGSPLPGWTTSYMGLLLKPGISRIEALQGLKSFAFKDLKCAHIEVMDRQLAAASLEPQYRYRSYSGFELDLSRDEDKLFSNFTPACRRNIKKSSSNGIVIEEANDPQFANDYYEQLKDVFAKQGLCPTYTIERVRKLISNLQPTGHLLLLRALNRERRCIATGIFPAMNDRAFFWGGASWRCFQHLRPNESLMWYAIRYWKRRGIEHFDFGGGGDYKRKYGTYEISVPWLRISRYPVLPLMRSGVMAITRLQQRWKGAWQLIQFGPARPSATKEVCISETSNVQNTQLVS